MLKANEKTIRTERRKNKSSGGTFCLTSHAMDRTGERGYSLEMLETVLTYGRVMYERGAKIFFLGKREVEIYKGENLNLIPYSGLHVVCSHDGAIMTVYRNHDIRPKRKRRTKHFQNIGPRDKSAA
ncbi:MAG: DUF4258 domain-containing protein [bacterium]